MRIPQPPADGAAGRSPRLLLEVIATTVADAVAVEQGGADRVELVADLGRGGMTPSRSLVEAVLERVTIPVRVMVRETGSHEVEAIAVRDRLIARAADIGALPVDGLVLGVTRGGRVDEELLGALLAASARPATFHRAFETLAMPDAALADLRRFPAIDRVLSSGGPGGWNQRAARLARWAALATPGIRLVVGGGITEDGLAAVAAISGIHEVHVGRAARDRADELAPVSASRVARLVRRLGLNPSA